MKRFRLIGASIVALIVLCACTPGVQVENKTKFVVRAVIHSSAGTDVVSPSPGESSSVEVEDGPYSVSVIPDSDWITHAQQTRDFLNKELADPSHLTGQQLLDVVNRLKAIASAMKQFEDAGLGTGCGGNVNSDNSFALVIVSAAADGKLTVICT